MGSDHNLRSRLESLAAFLPIFTDATFVFGTWTKCRQGASGLLQLPYVEFSREGKDFLAAAYQHGWVLDGFDWMEWSMTQEARDLMGHPDAIARASPDQLWKLITKSVREDRFVEGALLEDFERDHLTAIARRARALRDAM